MAKLHKRTSCFNHQAMFGLLLFSIFVLTSCGMNNKTKDIDLMGHRGCRGLFPENTIPGFIMAIDIGVNTLEMDIAISADRQVIVSHEPWFSASICLDPDDQFIPQDEEKTHRIFDMSHDEIKLYNCGSIRLQEFPDQELMALPKPILKELVFAVEDHISRKGLAPVKYNIEIKSRPEWDSIFTPPPAEFASILFREAKELGILDRLIIQSFDIRSLQEWRKLDKIAQICLLTSNNKGPEANVAALGFMPEIYGPNYELMKDEDISWIKSQGIKLIPWTVNDKSDMKSLLEKGVDGLITDFPNIGKEVISAYLAGK